MFRDPFGSKRIETDRGRKGRKRTRECAAARRMGKKGTLSAAAGSKASTERSGGSKKRSRADAQQENDREARAQTLGELKRIIEASGIRQVREAAFKANEFRDLLGHWQTRLRGLGVTQERDGLCFPKSAKIAFDMGTQQGGAAAVRPLFSQYVPSLRASCGIPRQTNGVPWRSARQPLAGTCPSIRRKSRERRQ